MNYQVRELLDHVYQIQEPEGYSATLITGTQKALVFDTMTGRGDLKSQIREITGLPVVVVNSHGHFDHVLGDVQFDLCYIHEEDSRLPDRTIRSYPGLPEDLKEACQRFLRWKEQGGKLLPIAPGERIDLGETEFEVVSLRGHTPGSIGLYCASKRLLLSGDAFTPQTCLLFPESLSVEEYIEMLDRTYGLEFDYFIAGHQCRMFPKELIKRFRECAVLAAGRGKSMRYSYTLNPAIRGRIYILEICSQDIGEMICLIDKDTEGSW